MVCNLRPFLLHCHSLLIRFDPKDALLEITHRQKIAQHLIFCLLIFAGHENTFRTDSQFSYTRVNNANKARSQNVCSLKKKILCQDFDALIMIMKYDIENCERFTDSLTDFGLPFQE